MTGPQSIHDEMEPGIVHVWKIDLDAAYVDPSESNVLSEDELLRERQFYVPLHRHRFRTCRSILRAILAHYTAEPAERLQFHYGAQGKPVLQNYRWLHFNVSHSEHMALCALAVSGPVGVDIECVREDLAFMEIARSYFTKAEMQKLEMFPATEQAAAFFACWTRKEAYIKAAGVGLSMPLDSFDVSHTLGRTGTALPVRNMHRPGQDEDVWAIHELQISKGMQGAVVSTFSQCQIRMYDWQRSD